MIMMIAEQIKGIDSIPFPYMFQKLLFAQQMCHETPPYTVN